MKLNNGISVEPFALGLKARSINLSLDAPYKFQVMRLNAGEKKNLSGLKRYCIYMIDVGGVRTFAANDIEIASDQFLLGDTADLTVKSDLDGLQVILISRDIDVLARPLTSYKLDSAKRVNKPWGYEIWLTNEPSEFFAFKKIFLRAGTSTSLQFHVEKRETNFLLSGTANLTFENRCRNGSDLSIDDALKTKKLVGPVVVNIAPGFVHRLEAKTDLTLYEASTPELDDVIRIQDNYYRGSGRIEGEHDN
jgi:mannose-6-phosphate isomerase